jgi:hypothetical protein
LNNWAFDPETTARPSVLGHWTNNIYDRVAPGLRPKLHSKVKRNAAGKPKEKMTQYLTPEEGMGRLKEMLEGIKALMKISRDKHDLWEKWTALIRNWMETITSCHSQICHGWKTRNERGRQLMGWMAP